MARKANVILRWCKQCQQVEVKGSVHKPAPFITQKSARQVREWMQRGW